MHPRLPLAALLVSILIAFGTPSTAGHRPELDVTASSLATPRLADHARRLASEPALRRVATVASLDPRFGVPAFAWVSRPAGPAASRATGTAAEAARAQLARVAPLWRLDPADVETATLRHLHDTGRGAVVATFRQSIGGVEVFRDEIKVMLDRDLAPVAVSGRIPSRSLQARGAARRFRLEAPRAVETALADFAGVAVSATPGAELAGGYRTFAVTGALPEAYAPSRPVRARAVWFHLPEQLVPGWYVEVMSEQAAYAYVVSAEDGRLLFRHDQMQSDAFTYRVWAGSTSPFTPYDSPTGWDPTPHPTALPDNYAPSFVPPVLVSLQNVPIPTNDPWLPPGATQTLGNNVDAYADLVAPDGFSAGDLRATTTSANTFDHSYDPLLAPGASNTQRQASVVNLFFVNNWLHDWFYNSGFDEGAGNAQASNYGRGGLEGDRLHAEAQDYSGVNNANMSTPGDGSSPRMQMYVFNPPTANQVVVTAPSAATYAAGVANGFGPQTFNVSGQVILGIDGTAPVNDGCSALTNAGSVNGKIVLLDRGSCTFGTKAQIAQNAGAIGLIIADNVSAATPPALSGTAPVVITIPSLSVTLAAGNTLKTQLGSGTVNVTLQRQAQLSRDGTLDNLIVAHEWGHYLSNRLIGNGAGLGNQQGGGMGEGWGDFIAMMMAVRESDGAAPANPDFAGVYGTAGYANSRSVAPNNAYYFGFRRYPYSTDFDYNPLTFRHIQNGVALPAGPPLSFGASGANNAEVHNTGEVWCVMLWECYAALIRDDPRLPFALAQQRMRDYVVAGCMLMPANPTFVEARDAMLAAAWANDPADHALMAAAFARRGLGTGAVAPDRFSVDQVGVVESYAVGGDLAIDEVTLTDDVASCDDDGYLDNAERGLLRITVRNTGTTTLSATVITVSSGDPEVSFPNGNTVHVPPTAPFVQATYTVLVELSGASGVETPTIQVSANDPGLLVAGPRLATLTQRVNVDETPSTLETVEAVAPPFTYPTVPPGLGDAWERIAITPTSHRFHCPDNSGVASRILVTPPIQVAATGSFTFSFEHAHSFEWDASAWWDAGVMEITTNGGSSWTDVGASASPTYGGVVFTGADNPLSGRNAYVGVSSGYPALIPVTVDLGTAYQGQTVQVRWVLGTDQAAGGPGWDIDNLQFNNIVGTPFAAVGPELDSCTPLAVDDPALPREVAFALAGAHPVTGPARLRFALPADADVALTVHDVTGRRVATLADGRYGAGEHTVTWRAADGGAAAGVYFARFRAGGVSFTRRLVVVR